MRKIAERSEGSYSYTVFEDREMKEYTVKYFFQGMLIQGANYYTNNEKDALSTAKKQLNTFIEVFMCKGA